MKVIDLQKFKLRKKAEDLGKRVSSLALDSREGSVKEMKLCFKEWLLRNV